MVGRQGGDDRVAPLDEHDGVLVEHLAEAEVGDLAQVLEAVHVEVVQGEAGPLVLADDRERRAGDAGR